MSLSDESIILGRFAGPLLSTFKAKREQKIQALLGAYRSGDVELTPLVAEINLLEEIIKDIENKQHLLERENP